MKTAHITIILLAALLLSISIPAQAADTGRIRGTFVKRAEVQVEEVQYLAIVVKPAESDDNVEVLVPRDKERLLAAARRLDEGNNIALGYVVEHGRKWLTAIQVRQGDRPAAVRATDQPRVVRQGDQPRIVREGDRPALRDGDRPRVVREGDRPAATRDGDRPRIVRQGDRPLVARQGDRPALRADQPRRDRPAEAEAADPRAAVGRNINNIMDIFRQLMTRVDRMNRELQDLRSENARLRRLLAANGISDRPAARTDRPREGQRDEPRRNPQPERLRETDRRPAPESDRPDRDR